MVANRLLDSRGDKESDLIMSKQCCASFRQVSSASDKAYCIFVLLFCLESEKPDAPIRVFCSAKIVIDTNFSRRHRRPRRVVRM